MGGRYPQQKKKKKSGKSQEDAAVVGEDELDVERVRRAVDGEAEADEEFVDEELGEDHVLEKKAGVTAPDTDEGDDDLFDTLFARRTLKAMGDDVAEEEDEFDDDDDENGDYNNISDMLQDDDELSETTLLLAAKARGESAPRRAIGNFHNDDDDDGEEDDDQEDDDRDDDGDDDDEENLIFSSDDDEGDDPEQQQHASEKLRALVSELSSSAGGKRRRRKRAEEGEAAAVEAATNVLGTSHAVSLDELLESIRDTTGLGSVKSQLGVLVHKERTGQAAVVQNLPPHEVERIQRRAAYEIVTTDLGKWSETVAQNRAAEHVSFVKKPLVDASSADMVSKFEPQTELETEMHALLKAAGATEDEVHKFEELELNKLTLEQAQKRQAELARMRVLLTRQEEKARRHAKIKSKGFRKVMRKEKAREAEKKEAAEEAAGGEGAFAAAVERQRRLEYERAVMRATQKHTKGDKWLQKQMKNHGMTVEGTKEAIAEAQRNAERLKAFVNQGRHTDAADADADAEPEPDFDDLAAYADVDADAEPETGLMAMKFMKRAIERNAQERLEAAERGDDYDNPAPDADAANAAAGRRSYGATETDATNAAASGSGVLSGSRKLVDGSALVGKAALSAGQKSRARDVMTIDFSDIVGAEAAVADDDAVADTGAASKAAAAAATPVVNPWLHSGATSSTAAASRRQLSSNRERALLDRGRVSDGASVREREARAAKAADEAGGGAELVIDVSSTLLNASGVTHVAGAAPRKSGAKRVADEALGEQPSAGDDAIGDARALADFDLGTTDERQQELINRAFATGADADEFQNAKKALVEAGLPQVPETLDTGPPGWGSWTGAGVVAKPLSAFKKRKLDALRAQVEQERLAALQKRKDAKLPNVIISEKRDKKVASVQLASLPYPFESEAHLHALTAAPLGPEWNSQRQHQRLVHPPVLTQAGQVIEPMKPTPEMEKRANQILQRRSLGAKGKKEQRK